MIVEEEKARFGEQGERPAFAAIRDLDSDDRPQERGEKHGVAQLATADLWALVLRSGQPGTPITELTRELMKANGQRLHTLERRSREELLQVKGIGRVKALQIEAVMELIRRYNLEEANEDPVIRKSKDIHSLMSPRISHLSHEEIWALLLNRQNRVLKILKLSAGGTASSIFDVKLLMKSALLESAEAIVLCHNHPSGTLRPSPQDDAITAGCRKAAESLSMRLLDHVIIGDTDYYSYSDNGRI